jgi:hypothetical protein
VKDMGLLYLEKNLQLPDAPGSLGGEDFLPVTFYEESKLYIAL